MKEGAAALLLALLVLTVSGMVYSVYYLYNLSNENLSPIDEPVHVAFVSGTEYKPGQTGQVVVEARLPNGNSVIQDLNGTTNCNSSIWYPDKTVFMADQVMNYSSSSENAYLNFTVPDIEGVYEYQSICVISGSDKIASKSFHVTKPRIRAEVVK